MSSEIIYPRIMPSQIYDEGYPKDPRTLDFTNLKFHSKEDLQNRINAIHGVDKFAVLTDDILGKAKPIRVMCSLHGEFMSTKERLTRYNGRSSSGVVGSCPACSKEISTFNKNEEKYQKLVKSVKSVHGDLISFEKNEFKGMGTEMKFVCKEHGEFYYTPDKIVLYNGCKDCTIPLSNPLTFIEESMNKFGSRFDYSLIETDPSGRLYAEVKLKCKEHDSEFVIQRTLHLVQTHGGCLKCATESASIKRSKPFSEFLSLSEEKFGGSKFIHHPQFYKNYKVKKTWITCNDHNFTFSILPKHHIGADTTTGGCPECTRELLERINRKSQDQFIVEAREAHKDRYDYSKTVYTNNRTRVTIICPDHGEFIQNPHSHISGDGCPTCGGYSFWGSRIDTTAEAYVYLMVISDRVGDEKFYKIGVSMNPEKRAIEITRDGGNYSADLVVALKGGAKEVHDIEKVIHDALKPSKYIPKNKFGGWTECFCLDDEFSFICDLMIDQWDGEWE